MSQAVPGGLLSDASGSVDSTSLQRTARGRLEREVGTQGCFLTPARAPRAFRVREKAQHGCHRASCTEGPFTVWECRRLNGPERRVFGYWEWALWVMPGRSRRARPRPTGGQLRRRYLERSSRTGRVRLLRRALYELLAFGVNHCPRGPSDRDALGLDSKNRDTQTANAQPVRSAD